MKLPEESSQRKALSNTVYWIVLAIMAVYFFSYFTFAPNPSLSLTFTSLVPVFLTTASILGIALSRVGFWSLSRIIFLTSWVILVNILPPALVGVRVGSYIIHPVLSITSSLMAQLFFSYYENRIAYVLFLSASLGLTVFSFDLLELFDSENAFDSLPVSKSQLVSVFGMCWLFVNLALMYVYRINWKTYKALQQKNEEIARLNADLEKRVDERTQQLKERNERLRAYAFMNAHVVRAPLSRILGLVNLLNNPQHDPKEETRIKNYLDESARQLDEVIRGASSQLEKNTDEDS